MIDLSCMPPHLLRPLPADIRLANGRTVKHRYARNGSQIAEIGPGINAFSPAEIAEYDRLRGYVPRRS